MDFTISFQRMIRLLSFRLSREEFLQLGRSELYLGLFFTWLAGVGRYWDDPKAEWLQHLGIGSIVYVFFFSALLWLILFPFRMSNWRYEQVLTFLCLTSFPAILYAIPVERFLSIDLSAQINAYFLLAVATWRVALLIFFLRRACQLTRVESFVGTFLPLTFIVASLTVLNLERAVFDIMGGIREKTSHDTAYLFLILISLSSAVLFVPILFSYIWICGHKRKQVSQPALPKD